MTEHNELSVAPPQQAHALTVTEPMLLALRQTKPWVRFLSVLGFISIALMLMSGTISMFVVFTHSQPEMGRVELGMSGVFYIVTGLLYFFPSLYLFKFASSIGRLLNDGGKYEMEQALSTQKSFWEFVGIMTIIGIVFMVIGIAAAIIIPQFVGHPGR